MPGRPVVDSQIEVTMVFPGSIFNATDDDGRVRNVRRERDWISLGIGRCPGGVVVLIMLDRRLSSGRHYRRRQKMDKETGKKNGGLDEEDGGQDSGGDNDG